MNSVLEKDLVKKVKAPDIFDPQNFIGIQTEYLLATGSYSRRIHFDSAASCLAFGPAYYAAGRYLEHYSNTHSDAHFSAKISTSLFRWSQGEVGKFVAADDQDYVVLYSGNGATGAINRASRLLTQLHPEKRTVLISVMEHHSNDLPHRENHDQYFHIPCVGNGSEAGQICLSALENLLIKHKDQISYVAVTGASNVTGIVNPIHDIAALAHQYNTLVLVDASQMIAHKRVQMSDDGSRERSIDALCFSGHKIYSPGSPGVLVVRKDLIADLAPSEFGGGMVDSVFTSDFIVNNNLPEREEAGTPNIYGAILLGCTLYTIRRAGFDRIAEHEALLLNKLLDELPRIPGVKVYGSLTIPRTGTVSFNLLGLDHELLARILNDYFNIAVRNQCFCAHPYVRELILKELWDLDPDLTVEEIEAKKGMVRVSLALYNTVQDIDLLLNAIRKIGQESADFTRNYILQEDGSYKNVNFVSQSRFDIEQVLDECF